MKRKMVSLRFTSLIMVALFLLHTLRNSLAHAHQAKVANSFETTITKENGGFGRKAKFDQDLALPNTDVAKGKKAAIGGRKMATTPHEVEEDDHRGMKKTPMLSGNEEINSLLKNTLTKSHDNHGSKNQISSNTLSVRSSKPGSDEERERSTKRDEQQRFVKEAKEIMKLMHKDYGRKWSPKRKPPINNHTPMH